MKAKKLTSRNFRASLNNVTDTVPVVGKHYNDFKDDFDAHVPSDGQGKFDGVDEYTSGAGISLKKETKVNVVSEYTSGSGITLDGVLLKDGLAGKSVSVTANTAGVQLTGANQFLTVVSSISADHILWLPALSSALVGAEIRGAVGANGFELRHLNPTATYLNNVTGGVGCEAAIPANSSFRVTSIAADRWLLNTWNVTGGAVVVVPNV